MLPGQSASHRPGRVVSKASGIAMPQNESRMKGVCVSDVRVEKLVWPGDLALDRSCDVSDDQLPESNPASRLLRVVESIARNGPITYEALRKDVELSKTATWRMVLNLREAGWVRVSSGGQLLQLHPRLDELFATAWFEDREFGEILDRLCGAPDFQKLHVDLFVMGPDNEPLLIDSTRRLTVSASRTAEHRESVILAVQSAMTRIQLARHLTTVLEVATPQQAVDIHSGAVQRRIRKARGFIWSETDAALYVALRGKMGTPAALRIRPKVRKDYRTVCAQAFVEFKGRLSEAVEVFGGYRSHNPSGPR